MMERDRLQRIARENDDTIKARDVAQAVFEKSMSKTKRPMTPGEISRDYPKIKARLAEIKEERDKLKARVAELEEAADSIETAAMSALRDGGCCSEDMPNLESACELICELVRAVETPLP